MTRLPALLSCCPQTAQTAGKACARHADGCKFERRSLSNTELMSAKADKENKFERRSLSNTELMSAKADKEDKFERRSLSNTELMSAKA
ncbi:MAG: hypothetical protein LBQ15_12525, partial [Clostridium sp.]|nr:hypothetical protein [Clostridium sp.]